MNEGRCILLTGASGFLGWNYLAARKIKGEIRALRHSSPLPDDPLIQPVDIDLSVPGSIKSAIRRIKPDIVIHTAAISKTGDCERNRELTRRINVEATREILESTDPEETRIIFTSTDLVFDGLKGSPYREQNATHPRMIYGETKREAEKLILARGGRFAILRLALMYGKGSPAYESFLGWLERGLQKGKVTLFTDEYRTPLYVQDAVRGLDRLADSDFSGILHLGGATRCSRYEFGLEFARRAGYSMDSIVPAIQDEVESGSPRPRDVSLDSSLAKKVLQFSPMTMQEGIQNYLETRE